MSNPSFKYLQYSRFMSGPCLKYFQYFDYRFWYLNSTDLNAHIDHLRPNTKYEFDVRIVKGRNQSPWSMKEINTTMEAGTERERERELFHIEKESYSILLDSIEILKFLSY